MINLKRLNKELHNLLDIYEEVIVRKKKGKFSFSIKLKKNNIILIFDDNYPFRYPNIKINNMSYISIISRTNKDYLKEINGFDCLCCNSLLCNDRWGPTIRIESLVNEIKNFLDIKIRIIERMSKLKQPRVNDK